MEQKNYLYPSCMPNAILNIFTFLNIAIKHFYKDAAVDSG